MPGGGSGSAPATKPAAKTAAGEAPSGAKVADAESPEKEAGGSPIDVGVRFIKANAHWIVIALFLLLCGILVWTYFGLRGKKAKDGGALSDLGFEEGPRSKVPSKASPKRFSSTKIQKADVSTRLKGAVTTTEVETDREYALVVDEEALKLPPLPEEQAQADTGSAADVEKLRQLLNTNRHREAYDEYAKELVGNPKLVFPGDLENALGEFLMKAKEYEKAARVLEHHVATQRKTDVRPETYFNLGYVHFMNRTLNKSRRFFKLFLETEKNPEYVARAKRILEKIEASSK